MSDEPVTTPSGAGILPPSSPFHPAVGPDASIDGCPFGPMIKALNVDPDLIFAVLQQYFGGATEEDEEGEHGDEGKP